MAEMTAELKALLAEYDQRRNESMAFYARYEKQTQLLTVYLSTLSVLYAVLLGMKGTSATFSFPGFGAVPIPKEISRHPDVMSAVGLSVGALIAFYFVSTLMETVHIMQLLQARSAALERAINKMLGDEYLTWDSRLIPEFYERRARAGLFVEPSWLVGLWAVGLFVFIDGVLVFMSLILLQNRWCYWAAPFSVLAAYHVAEWVWLLTGRKETMTNIARTHIELASGKRAEVDNR